MSEWLTTGQMIDSLEVGQWAVSENGDWKVTKTNDGRIVHDKRIDGHLTLSFDTSVRWCIPKYVSFVEAMEAYKRRKKIYFHGVQSTSLSKPIEIMHPIENFRNSPLAAYNILSLYNGKWTIGEDEYRWEN